MTTATSEPWQDKVVRKQAQVKSLIPKGWLLNPSFFPLPSNVLHIPRQSGILTEKELSITENYNASQLLHELAQGTFSSQEVTEAFCKRAVIAQQLTCCLTETMFDFARERAKFLDEYLAREKKPFGPFHGLPISLKDSFKVKGYKSTIGCVSFLDREPDTKNSVLVDTLLSLGAVLYVKTNVPVTLMTADTHNNIFSRTLNPHSPHLSSGGSTGGEASLLSLHGSILGIGTDIAGSIRIPSFSCGVYGFKPSSGRIPFGGQTSPNLPGIPGLISSAGPLAGCFDDLTLFVREVLNTNPWLEDSTAHAVHWREGEEISSKKILRIGVWDEDPLTPLHPPVRRTLTSAISALKAAGHQIITLSKDPPISAMTAGKLALETYMLDPTSTSLRYIQDSGEPLIPSVSLLLKGLADLKKENFGILELAQLNTKIAECKEAWREVWKKEGLDLVLGPAGQSTATRHDEFWVPWFTMVWNLLDYPACIIPFGKVEKKLDNEPFVIVPPATGPPYDLDVTEGSPCVIQIAAPRFMDEELLHAGKIIDDVLKNSV